MDPVIISVVTGSKVVNETVPVSTNDPPSIHGIDQKPRNGSSCLRKDWNTGHVSPLTLCHRIKTRGKVLLRPISALLDLMGVLCISVMHAGGRRSFGPWWLLGH